MFELRIEERETRNPKRETRNAKLGLIGSKNFLAYQYCRSSI